MQTANQEPPYSNSLAHDALVEHLWASSRPADARMRGGGEESGTPAEQQQSTTQTCLRLGAVPYWENGRFYFEGYERHFVLDKLDDEGRLVGVYMVPQPRKGRTRMLDEVSATLHAEASPESTPTHTTAPGHNSAFEATPDLSDAESDEEDEPFEPSAVPSDPSVASTSKGVSKNSKSSQDNAARQPAAKKTVRKKKERIANRTRSRDPESDARKKKSSKPKAVDSGDDSDEFDPKRRVPAPDDDDDEDEFSFAKGNHLQRHKEDDDEDGREEERQVAAAKAESAAMAASADSQALSAAITQPTLPRSNSNNNNNISKNASQPSLKRSLPLDKLLSGVAPGSRNKAAKSSSSGASRKEKLPAARDQSPAADKAGKEPDKKSVSKADPKIHSSSTARLRKPSPQEQSPAAVQAHESEAGIALPSLLKGGSISGIANKHSNNSAASNKDSIKDNGASAALLQEGRKDKDGSKGWLEQEFSRDVSAGRERKGFWDKQYEVPKSTGKSPANAPQPGTGTAAERGEREKDREKLRLGEDGKSLSQRIAEKAALTQKRESSSSGLKRSNSGIRDGGDVRKQGGGASHRGEKSGGGGNRNLGQLGGSEPKGITSFSPGKNPLKRTASAGKTQPHQRSAVSASAVEAGGGIRGGDKVEMGGDGEGAAGKEKSTVSAGGPQRGARGHYDAMRKKLPEPRHAPHPTNKYLRTPVAMDSIMPRTGSAKFPEKEAARAEAARAATEQLEGENKREKTNSGSCEAGGLLRERSVGRDPPPSERVRDRDGDTAPMHSPHASSSSKKRKSVTFSNPAIQIPDLERSNAPGSGRLRAMVNTSKHLLKSVIKDCGRMDLSGRACNESPEPGEVPQSVPVSHDCAASPAIEEGEQLSGDAQILSKLVEKNRATEKSPPPEPENGPPPSNTPPSNTPTPPLEETPPHTTPDNIDAWQPAWEPDDPVATPAALRYPSAALAPIDPRLQNAPAADNPECMNPMHAPIALPALPQPSTSTLPPPISAVHAPHAHVASNTAVASDAPQPQLKRPPGPPPIPVAAEITSTPASLPPALNVATEGDTAAVVGAPSPHRSSTDLLPPPLALPQVETVCEPSAFPVANPWGALSELPPPQPTALPDLQTQHSSQHNPLPIPPVQFGNTLPLDPVANAAAAAASLNGADPGDTNVSTGAAMHAAQHQHQQVQHVATPDISSAVQQVIRERESRGGIDKVIRPEGIMNAAVPKHSTLSNPVATADDARAPVDTTPATTAATVSVLNGSGSITSDQNAAVPSRVVSPADDNPDELAPKVKLARDRIRANLAIKVHQGGKARHAGWNSNARMPERKANSCLQLTPRKRPREEERETDVPSTLPQPRLQKDKATHGGHANAVDKAAVPETLPKEKVRGKREKAKETHATALDAPALPKKSIVQKNLSEEERAQRARALHGGHASAVEANAVPVAVPAGSAQRKKGVHGAHATDTHNPQHATLKAGTQKFREPLSKAEAQKLPESTPHADTPKLPEASSVQALSAKDTQENRPTAPSTVPTSNPVPDSIAIPTVENSKSSALDGDAGAPVSSSVQLNDEPKLATSACIADAGAATGIRSKRKIEALSHEDVLPLSPKRVRAVQPCSSHSTHAPSPPVQPPVATPVASHSPVATVTHTTADTVTAPEGVASVGSGAAAAEAAPEAEVVAEVAPPIATSARRAGSQSPKPSTGYSPEPSAAQEHAETPQHAQNTPAHTHTSALTDAAATTATGTPTPYPQSPSSPSNDAHAKAQKPRTTGRSSIGRMNMFTAPSGRGRAHLAAGSRRRSGGGGTSHHATLHSQQLSTSPSHPTAPTQSPSPDFMAAQTAHASGAGAAESPPKPSARITDTIEAAKSAVAASVATGDPDNETPGWLESPCAQSPVAAKSAKSKSKPKLTCKGKKVVSTSPRADSVDTVSTTSTVASADCQQKGASGGAAKPAATAENPIASNANAAKPADSAKIAEAAAAVETDAAATADAARTAATPKLFQQPLQQLANLAAALQHNENAVGTAQPAALSHATTGPQQQQQKPAAGRQRESVHSAPGQHMLVAQPHVPHAWDPTIGSPRAADPKASRCALAQSEGSRSFSREHSLNTMSRSMSLGMGENARDGDNATRAPRARQNRTEIVTAASDAVTANAGLARTSAAKRASPALSHENWRLAQQLLAQQQQKEQQQAAVNGKRSRRTPLNHSKGDKQYNLFKKMVAGKSNDLEQQVKYTALPPGPEQPSAAPAAPETHDEVMEIVNSAEKSLREQHKRKWQLEHSCTTQQFAASLVKGMDTAVHQMQEHALAMEAGVVEVKAAVHRAVAQVNRKFSEVGASEQLEQDVVLAMTQMHGVFASTMQGSLTHGITATAALGRLRYEVAAIACAEDCGVGVPPAAPTQQQPQHLKNQNGDATVLLQRMSSESSLGSTSQGGGGSSVRGVRDAHGNATARVSNSGGSNAMRQMGDGRGDERGHTRTTMEVQLLQQLEQFPQQTGRTATAAAHTSNSNPGTLPPQAFAMHMHVQPKPHHSTSSRAQYQAHLSSHHHQQKHDANAQQQRAAQQRLAHAHPPSHASAAAIAAGPATHAVHMHSRTSDAATSAAQVAAAHSMTHIQMRQQQLLNAMETEQTRHHQHQQPQPQQLLHAAASGSHQGIHTDFQQQQMHVASPGLHTASGGAQFMAGMQGCTAQQQLLQQQFSHPQQQQAQQELERIFSPRDRAVGSGAAAPVWAAPVQTGMQAQQPQHMHTVEHHHQLQQQPGALTERVPIHTQHAPQPVAMSTNISATMGQQQWEGAGVHVGQVVGQQLQHVGQQVYQGVVSQQQQMVTQKLQSHPGVPLSHAEQALPHSAPVQHMVQPSVQRQHVHQ